MKKELIYFTDGAGLTSTSANHIADLAKNWQEPIKTKLNSIGFVNETMEVLGEKQCITKKANTEEEIKEIPTLLAKISEADLLAAWLREAVKAREAMLREVQYMNISIWASCIGKTLPDSPEKEDSLTEDDYIASLSIKERQEWLRCNQYAATLGKYIHPSGRYANSRDFATKVANNPSSVNGTGRDTIITRWKIAVPTELIDNTFFELQEQHREYQARLNGFKHSMEQAILKSQTEVTSAYNTAVVIYQAEYNALTAEFEAWKKAEMQRISDLKIVIPNDLKDIYNFINSLGKKKK